MELLLFSKELLLAFRGLLILSSFYSLLFISLILLKIFLLLLCYLTWGHLDSFIFFSLNLALPSTFLASSICSVHLSPRIGVTVHVRTHIPCPIRNILELTNAFAIWTFSNCNFNLFCLFCIHGVFWLIILNLWYIFIW